ncbi:MAG: T9SS type A sorting domain-containing protein [Flavobacteriaceae bacterium]|nr:T9SS type A sorting domain-containing protein [Flavobacteriaceae bacterium]
MKLKLLITILYLFGVVFTNQANNDKYRLILVDDPSTTITIAWNQISGTNQRMHYDIVDHGTDHTLYAFSKTVDREIDFKGMSNQFVRLSGLTPNTNYYFVINDSEGTSQRFWFKTAPNDNSRLFFIAGGDSRNNRTPRQNANTLVSKLKPHAVLFGGDMTDDDTNTEWQNWFDDWQLTIAQDGRMFPIVPARGNHESPTSVYNLFDTPTNNSYYAMTWGDNLIRTYTLNSEISVLGDQLTWLENDLSESSGLTWKMAQYHKPMRPHTAAKSEGNSEYEAWAQLFYDEQVRLVVDCDSHMLKTTWPVRPSAESGNDEGFEIDEINGTVYTGEGCWGAPLRPNNDDKIWTRNSGSFNQFKLIFVDEEKIELRTINVNNANSVADGSNTDPFTLPANLNIFSPPTGAVVTISNTVDNNCPIIGTPCDDGDANTIYDEEDGFCNCAGLLNVELTVQDNAVSASGDDAEEELATGTIDLTSSDLELIYDGGNQLVGVRFDNVQIPDGATLYRAYIQFTVDEDDSEEDPTDLVIHGELAQASTTFTDTANDISSRALTSNYVNWNEINLWETVGESGLNQRTPYVTNIVNEIVSQAGWTSGNAITFIISGTGKRVAESVDGSAAPILKLFYQSPCNPIGTACDDGDANTLFDVEDGNCNCSGIPETGTLTYEVNRSNNDAEEEVANGDMSISSSDLELVDESGSTNQLVGIRFTDIQLPAGADIINAYIQFTVDDDNTGVTNLEIRAEVTANSLEFTSADFDISARTTGTNVIAWDNIPSWGTNDIGLAGPNQQTPNISVLVEEILSQPGWDLLKSMTFIISGTGEREAESFDGTAAPQLVIEYSLATLRKNDNNQSLNDIKVYPNPASSELSIEANLTIDNLSIYDINGRLIDSIQNANSELKLDVSNLTKGIYFIEIQSGNIKQTLKFVKN